MRCWAWCVGFVFCGLALAGGAMAPLQAGEAATPKAGAAQQPAKAADAAAKTGDEGTSPAKPAGQSKAPAASEKPYVSPPPAAGQPMAGAGTRPGPFRPLAPGTLRSVDPMSEFDETVSRHDVVELGPPLEGDLHLGASVVPVHDHLVAGAQEHRPGRSIHAPQDGVLHHVGHGVQVPRGPAHGGVYVG